MTLAAEVIDPAVMQWAVSLGLGGVVSLFVVLAKKAFTDLESELAATVAKTEALTASQSHSETRLSVLETKMMAMGEDVIGLRESRHRHGDAIASLQARIINRTTSGSFPKVGDDE